MSFFISNTILKMQNTFIIKWSQAICRILNNFRNITWNCIQWKVWPFFSYFSYKVVVYLKPDKVLRLLYTLLLGIPSSPGCGYTSSSCALNSSSANKSGSSTQSNLSLSLFQRIHDTGLLNYSKEFFIYWYCISSVTSFHPFFISLFGLYFIAMEWLYSPRSWIHCNKMSPTVSDPWTQMSVSY